MPGARTVREVLAALRGVTTTPRINRQGNTVINLDIILMKNDPSRLFFMVANFGPQDVVMAPLALPFGNQGVRIPANGGALTVQFDEDGEVVAYEWHAIAAGGATTVFTLEAVIEPRETVMPAHPSVV